MIIQGDALETLRSMPQTQVAAVVTSPPYYGLRKYGDDSRESGINQTVDEYIAALVSVFDAVRQRHGHRDSQYWINLGDTANAYQHNRGAGGDLSRRRHADRQPAQPGLLSAKHKNKTFLAIPQRFAVAMVDAGFHLRAEIAWLANRMPESTRTRPHRTTERILFFTQHDRCRVDRTTVPDVWRGDVWRVPAASGKSSHPARFSSSLVEACLSWLPDQTPGVVLDPYAGSGTSLEVAKKRGRIPLGIDLYRWAA